MTHLRMLRIIVNKRWWAQIFNFVTVVKYSLTINTWKKIYIKNYCFLLIPSGCKTRSSLIQNLSRFSRWKSLHRQVCSMTRFFILLKSSRLVRESEVLAHRKKWVFCKVTPLSIQTFVEGLLRLANVLEATNGTLKNVNNICSLAINSTKYFL